MPPKSPWSAQAVARIEADFCRSADTHLIALPLPHWTASGIDVYLKDESTHPTGSLKHRLARSLFLYALCNGWLREGMTVIEASSGSTAVSEAYFARLLGLPFIAVMPQSTSAEKIALLRFYGGACHFVEHAHQVYAAAAALAVDCGGHYMDQFTYAERATDWRGNNNIAHVPIRFLSVDGVRVGSGEGAGGVLADLGAPGCAANLARLVDESDALPVWQLDDAFQVNAVRRDRYFSRRKQSFAESRRHL